MDFKFDWQTSVITIVIGPIIGVILVIIARHAKRLFAFVTDALLSAASRGALYHFAKAFSAKRYAHLQLRNEALSTLRVPSRIDVSLPVDRVYVPLTLTSSGRQTRGYSHKTISQAGNRIIIVGDPGSGKSSLLKRIFRDRLQRLSLSRKGAILPILVQLKELSEDVTSGEALLAWVREDLKKSAAYGLDEMFDRYLERDGVMFLLDGLDEIASARYVEIQASIAQLCDLVTDLGPQNEIVITSRTQFYQQTKHALSAHFSSVLSVEPFTPTDIYEFLCKWPDMGPDAVSRIFLELTERPSLRDMCQNPLVLAMYVAHALEQINSIAPESRTEFYTRISEELLIYRRLDQNIVSGDQRIRLQRQREQVLGRLALEHLLNNQQGANSLDFKRAVAITASVCRCGEGQATDLFLDIAKETGLIGEERPGETLRFIHLTFCEYFAAREAVHGARDGWSILFEAHVRNRASSPEGGGARLAEVIPFAIGLLPRVQAQAALAQLLINGEYRTVVNSALEAKDYASNGLHSFVKDFIEILIAAPRDDQWLRDVHLMHMLLRDMERSSIESLPQATELRTQFFLRLALSDESAIGSLLDGLARSDAAAAASIAKTCGIDLWDQFTELVISCLDQPPFFGLVMQEIERSSTLSARQAYVLLEAALRSAPVKISLISRGTLGFVASSSNALKWLHGNLPPSLFRDAIRVVGEVRMRVPGCALCEMLYKCPHVRRSLNRPSGYRLLDTEFMKLSVSGKRSGIGVFGAFISGFRMYYEILRGGRPSTVFRNERKRLLEESALGMSREYKSWAKEFLMLEESARSGERSPSSVLKNDAVPIEA